MTPTMMLRLALGLAVPLLTLGTRSDRSSMPLLSVKQSALSYHASMRYVEASRGVPKLGVLRTSDAEEAAAFLSQWTTAKDFGLFVHTAPSSVGLLQQRVAILGISRGEQVLLYDMRPFLLQAPRPLPKALSEFLESKEHTFFGMGLLRPVAQLTREFGITVRSIDMKVRGWPQAKAEGGGLYRAADRILGVTLARRPSLRQLNGQAVYAYLQWALAERCRTKYGAPEAAWILSQEELADARAPRARPGRPRIGSISAEEQKHQQEAHTEQEYMHGRAARLEERRTKRNEKRERFASAHDRGGLPTRQWQQQHGAAP